MKKKKTTVQANTAQTQLALLNVDQNCQIKKRLIEQDNNKTSLGLRNS